MKRFFFICIVVCLFFCESCCRNEKNSIFRYCDLQDSLVCFISKAPNFPEKSSSFICVIFHAQSFEERVDTIVVLMKGNGPFSPVNGQIVIGATYFDKHICEVVYDGFEHLPSIVNEDILLISSDDYMLYGYDKKILGDPKYMDELLSSGINKQKQLLTRTFRLNRPNILERIR